MNVRQLGSVKELITFVKQCWSEMPRSVIRSLLCSIPNRYTDLLEGFGGATHYSYVNIVFVKPVKVLLCWVK